VWSTTFNRSFSTVSHHHRTNEKLSKKESLERFSSVDTNWRRSVYLLAKSGKSTAALRWRARVLRVKANGTNGSEPGETLAPCPGQVSSDVWPRDGQGPGRALRKRKGSLSCKETRTAMRTGLVGWWADGLATFLVWHSDRLLEPRCSSYQ